MAVFTLEYLARLWIAPENPKYRGAVGYGDVFPITMLGKMFAASIAVLGIGMFALPTGILGSAFVEEVESQRQNDNPPEAFVYCPHCGKNLPSDSN